MSRPAQAGRKPGFQLGPLLLALAIGSAGGWGAAQLKLPLAWMLGAMVATTIAAVSGLRIGFSPLLRAVMVALLGIMLGSRFSPDILARIADWAVSLSVLAAYVATAGGAALLYFRRVAGYDPITAYFSAMPGGLSEMIIVGTEMGGDSRVIALVHASRVLLVVLALPFAFQALLGVDLGNRPPAGQPLLTLAPQDLLLLGVTGLIGALAAKALKLPAALLVGPMVLSALVHLTGVTKASPPLELVAAAQVVIGSAIGARFTGTRLSMIWRTTVIAGGATAILVAVAVAFALALNAATGLPVAALVLAYAPGGLAEMSLIALALSLDAAFVATHHIVRIFLVVLIAPTLFRRRLRGAPPPA